MGWLQVGEGWGGGGGGEVGLEFRYGQGHCKCWCPWFLPHHKPPEVLRTGKTHAQRTLDRGQGAPRLKFSCLPLLTTHTVGGGCGSFRVGRCVSGPLWGVRIPTSDQTPGRQINRSRERERGKERGCSPCITVWESPGKSRERILVLGAQINRKEKSACSLALWETPYLPLTQGQGRPWRGPSSHVVLLGPHSQLRAAACSPCHAQSPPGSNGEGVVES